MNKKQLNKAVQEGIISQKQADLLFNFLSDSDNSVLNGTNTNISNSDNIPISSSGEQLKFLRSFGDIFIALGVLLLAFTSHQLATSILEQILIIVGFYVISEWLVGIKRLVLPGITLLLSILYFVNEVVDINLGMYESLDVIFMIMASLLFYLRYKMPFSLYPVAVGCIYLSIELFQINVIEHPYIFIILGLIVFSFAMWYDSRDTNRITSLSDNGFWLHLLAAPLIVHGVMVSLFLSEQQMLQVDNMTIMTLFTLFFFIALFVDRRAILVSSFAYALFAVFKFAYQQFMEVDNLTLFILMGVGLFIIFFGTYWYKVRKLVFSPIASWRISQFVPSFEVK
ncbi:MAG: hypothetical protein HQL46_02875 [Gammaproteobacteria bacterium]|nr:hypothetical protein [Gammaproteobacteria bacterium]